MSRDDMPPAIRPVLDPGFQPAALAGRAFRRALEKAGAAQTVPLALEQADGSVFHFQTVIAGTGAPDAPENLRHLERFLKFILWSRGGFRVHLAAPPALAEALRRHYRENPAGRFDAELMGERIYERPFEIRACRPDELPAPRENTRPLGRHFNGGRIGFDLGASDLKVASVQDGQVLYSDEFAWDPVKQADPQYHYDRIMDALKKAAAHLARVDAIGGSSAGVYVDNRVKVASLFRGIPQEVFNRRVKDLFLEIRRAWNNIPLDVVNDGEVTALAGSMSMNAAAVLGVALGSSEAAGYVTPGGNITSWMNELAFAPIDVRPDAPVDEWSGDRGCGSQYLSQQAVGRLVAPAGLDLDPALPLPEKLKRVQEQMAAGDERARKIYETVGVYLGYAVAHYAAFYDIRNVLILGRVTSGPGGAVILEQAQRVLRADFPEQAEKIKFCTPDEREKRHGQAMAAASLPVVG